MSLRLQILLLIFLGIGIAVVVNTKLIKAITRALGIQSTMNMIFFCGFLLSLVIIFSLTVAISKVTAEVRRMSQTIAMLDKKLLESSSGDTEEKELIEKS